MFHPRAFLDSLLAYRRFIGTIKPRLMSCSEMESRAYLALLHRAWSPSPLQVPAGRRLMVLAAHPDDESIGAWGLLLAHRGKSEIHLVNLFNGEGGGRLPRNPWQNTPEYKTALAAARRKEFEAVARRLNAASLHYLDLRDGQTLPNETDAMKLGRIAASIRPDVVLIPWYLDNQQDHRVTNVLYAWGCPDLECRVLAFEIWTLTHPNAVLEVSEWIEEKRALIRTYETQNNGVDYAAYAGGLATVRAFHCGTRPDRGGAAEALLALPNRDYCDLVQSLYGPPFSLHPAARSLL